MESKYKELPFMQYSHSVCEDEDVDAIVARCHALASPERVLILRALRGNSMTISEIARKFYLSVSTATFHLHILQKAGLIDIVLMPGKRGHVQLCQVRFTSLSVYSFPLTAPLSGSVVTQEIPVGLYTGADMQFVAGFCTADEQIMFDDGNFFSPRRAEALLLWASGGYVEYAISNTRPQKRLERISISLEVCSETMNYQLGWKSDITFWLCGREIATYTSPSDFGGRRGALNPAWWPDHSTQFGERKEITITREGCFLDSIPLHGDGLPTVADFDGLNTLVLRIGNKPDAAHIGGFNLFGRGFGDHAQDIRVELEYAAEADEDKA